MTSTREQEEALDAFLQSYITASDTGLPFDESVGPTAAQTASLMDMLVTSCEDAAEMVDSMDVNDVAQALKVAIGATHESVSAVKQQITAVVNEPNKIKALAAELQASDIPWQNLLGEVSHGANRSNLLEDTQSESRQNDVSAQMTPHDTSDQLVLYTPEEENVRTAMVVAGKMCSIVETALSSVSDSEVELAAHLSLDLAQRALEAGQSFFTSLGDENRQRARDERSERITVEEMPDDNERAQDKVACESRQRRKKNTPQLKECLDAVYESIQKNVAEHPFTAGALAILGFPFIGLVIPMASAIGAALLLEKHFPEHSAMTMAMCANFLKMMRLWLLVVKISARQAGIVAKESFKSWYEYASTHGFVSTGVELASTGYSIGCIGVSKLCQSTLDYATGSSHRGSD